MIKYILVFVLLFTQLIGAAFMFACEKKKMLRYGVWHRHGGGGGPIATFMQHVWLFDRKVI